METRRKKFGRKKLVIVAGLTVLAIVSAGAWWFLTKSETTDVFGAASEKTAEKPKFKTVQPTTRDGKPKELQRVSPPESDPVFAYADTIDSVSVIVSQQPLPKDFKGHVEESVERVAKDFEATTKLKADDTTVWVGTSAKGPQSVVLTKNNLLILIKSQKKVSDQAWTTYVKSLD